MNVGREDTDVGVVANVGGQRDTKTDGLKRRKGGTIWAWRMDRWEKVCV